MTTKVTSSVLANTGVVADTYGSSSLVPIITIDAQGRITSATAATVSGAGAGVGATTYTQTKFTATAGQTVFSVSYTVGYVQVFLNGVLLDSLTEFTASNGTSITLSTAAALNDIITVYAYSVNTIANIAGGAAGTVIYQSAANTTSNTDVGTTGHLLTSAGAGKPYWTAQTALSIANTQITGTITAPQIAPGVIPAGGFSNMRVFTAPGCFTTPPTTTKIKVTVIGGGGGGGGGTGCCGVAGSGGGGGAAIRTTTVSAATPYPVSVGSGGTPAPGTGPSPANYIGGTGGTSSFGSIASATGGGGGPNSSGLTFTAGGIGSIPGATTCGFTVTGGRGMASASAGVANSDRKGGDSLLGFGGISTLGVTGQAYGGGGAGGVGNSLPSATGGAGGAGIVIVEY